jgi:hypothetical protein
MARTPRKAPESKPADGFDVRRPDRNRIDINDLVYSSPEEQQKWTAGLITISGNKIMPPLHSDWFEKTEVARGIWASGISGISA